MSRYWMVAVFILELSAGCTFTPIKSPCDRFLAKEIIGDPLLDLHPDNMERWLVERLGYTRARKMFEGNRFESMTLSDEYMYYELDGSNPRWPYPFSIEMMFQNGEPLFIGIYTPFQPATLLDLEHCLGKPAAYEAFHNLEKTPAGEPGNWRDSYLALWYPDKSILAVRTATAQVYNDLDDKSFDIASPTFGAESEAGVMLYYIPPAVLEHRTPPGILTLIRNRYRPVTEETQLLAWPGRWDALESIYER